MLDSALRFSFDCQLGRRNFEVGSSKFESHSRDFLMIVVRMAMSSLASAINGSNRSLVITSDAASSLSQ